MLLLDGEQSRQSGDVEMSKMAVQEVKEFKKSQNRMKYLLRPLTDKYKQIIIKKQKILVNILNSPHPMREDQIKDLRKSHISSMKFITYIKATGMIVRETYKQLRDLFKTQIISMRKLNYVKGKMNDNVDKNKDTVSKADKVQLMTKDQLKAFKEVNKDDKFIETPDKDVRLMKEKEIDTFRNNNPDANIINIKKKERLTDKQKMQAFREYQTNFVSTLYEMLELMMLKLKEFQRTSLKNFKILNTFQ